MAWLLHRYGEQARAFIARYFNRLTLLFLALLIAGFVLLEYVL